MKQKASKDVTLKLISGGATAVLVASCGVSEVPVPGDTRGGEVVEVHGYKDPDACAAGGIYTESFCRTSFNDAMAQHEKYSPVYESKQDCEADYGMGGCEVVEPIAVDVPVGEKTEAIAANNNNQSSGGSGFMPFMMGYLLGQNSANTAAIMSSGHSAPLYRSNYGGGYTTPSGGRFGSDVFNGVSKANSSVFTPPASRAFVQTGKTNPAIQRGGLGTTARAGASPSMGG